MAWTSSLHGCDILPYPIGPAIAHVGLGMGLLINKSTTLDPRVLMSAPKLVKTAEKLRKPSPSLLWKKYSSTCALIQLQVKIQTASLLLIFFGDSEI